MCIQKETSKNNRKTTWLSSKNKEEKLSQLLLWKRSAKPRLFVPLLMNNPQRQMIQGVTWSLWKLQHQVWITVEHDHDDDKSEQEERIGTIITQTLNVIIDTYSRIFDLIASMVRFDCFHRGFSCSALMFYFNWTYLHKNQCIYQWILFDDVLLLIVFCWFV